MFVFCRFSAYFIFISCWFLTCLSSVVLHDIAVLYFICVRLARFKKLLTYIKGRRLPRHNLNVYYKCTNACSIETVRNYCSAIMHFHTQLTMIFNSRITEFNTSFIVQLFYFSAVRRLHTVFALNKSTT